MTVTHDALRSPSSPISGGGTGTTVAGASPVGTGFTSIAAGFGGVDGTAGGTALSYQAGDRGTGGVEPMDTCRGPQIDALMTRQAANIVLLVGDPIGGCNATGYP